MRSRVAQELPRFVNADATAFRRSSRLKKLSNGSYLESNLSAAAIHRLCVQTAQLAGLGPTDWSVTYGSPGVASTDVTPEAEDQSHGVDDRADSAKFNDECVNRISKYLGTSLIKQGACKYANAIHTTAVVCVVSKEYVRTDVFRYWYAFRPSQKDFLEGVKESFVAFGCGSAEQLVLVPSEVFKDFLPGMGATKAEGSMYWHVEIFKKGTRLLLTKSTSEGVDITQYRI